jgi:glutamyl-tRNA synthetase
MDLNKLTNLNGQYMMELPPDEFVAGCRAAASRLPWAETADATYFRRVAELMRSRTKLFSQVAQWEPFFVPEPTYDEGAAARLLGRSEVRAALLRLCEQLRVLSFSLGEIERAIHECEAAAGIPQGKLNQPLRLAVTGSTIGAGIYETMELLGRDLVLRRLQHAIGRFCPGVPPATPSR